MNRIITAHQTCIIWRKIQPTLKPPISKQNSPLLPQAAINMLHTVTYQSHDEIERMLALDDHMRVSPPFTIPNIH